MQLQIHSSGLISNWLKQFDCWVQSLDLVATNSTLRLKYRKLNKYTAQLTRFLMIAPMNVLQEGKTKSKKQHKEKTGWHQSAFNILSGREFWTSLPYISPRERMEKFKGKKKQLHFFSM